MGFFYCFEFSISRKCLGFFYFRTKFGILAWVLLVNLSKNLTWFLLVNLTKNAQIFPALRAESVGVLLLFCEISSKKVGVLLFDGGWFYSQYRGGHFKDGGYFKNSYKIQFWSYEKKSPDLKRSR